MPKQWAPSARDWSWAGDSNKFVGPTNAFAGFYPACQARALPHVSLAIARACLALFVNGRNVERRTYHLAAAMLANGSVIPDT
jgi:hypothetical protein